MSTVALEYQIRWMMAKADTAGMVEVEQLCFDAPWTGREFAAYVRRDGASGLVALQGRTLVGYVLFESRRKRTAVDNLAVHPDHRRQRVATRLLGSLLPQLHNAGIRRVTAAVREDNLEAQLFFRANGFRAHVLRNYFHEPEEDAYEFELALGGAG